MLFNSLETKVNEMVGKYEKVILSQAIILADRHTGIESLPCDKIVKSYMEDNKKDIKYVVDLGDGIDNPFMSDYAVDPKFINSAQVEFDMYASHWKTINDILPRAKKIIIPGNHDKGRLDKSKTLNRGIASLRNLQYENVLREALSTQGLNLNNFRFPNKNYIIQFTKSNGALFTHGDARLDTDIKAGITGARRTANEYPTEHNIYMGHVHHHIEFPRRYVNKHLVVIGGLFDIEKMKEMYISWHQYDNGFGVIKYNKAKDLYQFDYIPIVNGRAVIDGKVYKG